MKTYVPIPESIDVIDEDLINSDLAGEQFNEESTEEEASSDSDTSTSNSDSQQSTVDSKIFSITEWFEFFKQLPQPQTILVKIPNSVRELFVSSVNMQSINDYPPFDTFKQELETAIAKVGGTAFVKDNWHAPKDAAMFSLNHLLKVSSIQDVFTYMKYSNIIMTDLDTEREDINFVVCVRPWMDIHPASEFRCIVVNRQLVGITPREWPKYYAHYKDIMPELIETAKNLFVNQIQYNFTLSNFTFDMIYTSPDDYMFWDFGPLNNSSKLYAFNWEEISNILHVMDPNRPPVFRFLAEECGILPNNISYEQHCD